MSNNESFNMLKLRINRPMEPYLLSNNTVYNKTCIFEADIDHTWTTLMVPNRYNINELSMNDSEVIQVGINTPANQWAIQNCLDEMIYIFKDLDNFSYCVKLVANVYLTEEQITFWRLKCPE